MAFSCVSLPSFHPLRLKRTSKFIACRSIRAHCFLGAVTSAPSATTLNPIDIFNPGSMQTLATTTLPKLFSLDAASNCIQGLVVADLDPATAKVAIGITGPFLSAFGFLFIIRIVMSWYPKLPVGKFPYVLAYAPTEPFLRITRKLIPPLGGVDVTPVVWFGLVSFLNEILVGPQGLLVLLSQQV
ncbi:hypothetical protein J5N97_029041 [Dioscorea zingiberensis]|uniref:Protein COFACTOR ASSEMBLY OF COMPLEX C SUBUNIT B CCB3, chloroplastic n=1 Tax=Dioscorea zingiberensis TaxID=325984 RepID=A0A9D5H5A6_9LILI|nr:hypothetical protein J5N97_029041 [Dioscorea zingiberensis]